MECAVSYTVQTKIRGSGSGVTRVTPGFIIPVSHCTRHHQVTGTVRHVAVPSALETSVKTEISILCLLCCDLLAHCIILPPLEISFRTNKTEICILCLFVL